MGPPKTLRPPSAGPDPDLGPDAKNLPDFGDGGGAATPARPSPSGGGKTGLNDEPNRFLGPLRPLRLLARAIAASQGWRRRLIAFAAGATGALALPPVNFMPALAVSLTIAVWLIDGAVAAAAKRPVATPARDGPWLPAAAPAAFRTGWFWGLGYMLAGLWWLGAAFLVEADQFLWALPLGVLGFPAAMALYPAFGFFLAGLVWPAGPARILTFAAAVALSEWMRGVLFTGFPWNLYGMALGGHLVTAQAASLVGLYGLTIIALVLFSAPATLADAAPGRSRLAPLAAALACLIGLAGFGVWRLAHAQTGAVADLTVRIIQPNLTLGDKFRPEHARAILERYLELSASPRETPPGVRSLVIWPESAFPFILSHSPQALAMIGEGLAPGAVLLTGAARAEGGAYFNAVHVIAGGAIVDTYDKSHLVPFGEYLPLETLAARIGLRQFVSIPGGFEAGPGRRTLYAPGLPPIAPLICYEAIFPGQALPQEPGAPRPGLILNVTDDGWFGETAGPHQHFAQARLRAIEEGLPLLRAANTGVSAIVDPFGRIVSSLPLGAEGTLEGALPEAIAPPFFAAHGSLPALALWFAASFAGIAAFLRKAV